jgi:FMN phosphatase YigB (HAD superfamily)
MVFIDDLEANVAAARACGWHGVVYRSPGDLAARLAELGVFPGPSGPGYTGPHL